jgi:hypothetical protein
VDENLSLSVTQTNPLSFISHKMLLATFGG